VGPSEYVLVFVSIILGLGIGDMLVSLHRMLRAGRAVRWDWATPWSAVIVLFLNLRTWWGLFPGKDDHAPMTIAAFLPLLVTMVLLFLLSASVLPDDVPEEGVDLKTYYAGNSRYFWSLMSLLLAFNSLQVIWEHSAGGTKMVRALEGSLVDLVVLMMFGSLIIVRARWWHVIVLLLAISGPAFWLSRSVG
jgi:hypothetical protein